MAQMNLFMKHTFRHRKQTYGYQRGKLGGWRRDRLGVWDWQMQTAIYKMDKQQGPTVWCRELYSRSYNKPSWKRILKKIYGYIYMYICMYS